MTPRLFAKDSGGPYAPDDYKPFQIEIVTFLTVGAEIYAVTLYCGRLDQVRLSSLFDVQTLEEK